MLNFDLMSSMGSCIIAFLATEFFFFFWFFFFFFFWVFFKFFYLTIFGINDFFFWGSNLNSIGFIFFF